MQNTPNYGLKKPAQSDFYNVDDFNANTDIIDTEFANANADISNLETNKLNKTGDASNVTNTFTQASTRANLVSGENQSTTFGKLMKWFADLKPVAWSGNASDLTEDASNRLVTDSEKNTWNAKASTAPVTTTANGLMISTDKTKLDGVATGANNYTHPATHPPSIIAQDASNRFVTDAEKSTWNGKLDAASYTAADVLAKTKTVDGSGSGLDADFLDGLHGTSYVRADGSIMLTGDLNVGGNNIVNVANGVNPTDAVNKQQLDAVGVGSGAPYQSRTQIMPVSQGSDWVRVATLPNGNTSTATFRIVQGSDIGGDAITCEIAVSRNDIYAADGNAVLNVIAGGYYGYDGSANIDILSVRYVCEEEGATGNGYFDIRIFSDSVIGQNLTVAIEGSSEWILNSNFATAPALTPTQVALENTATNLCLSTTGDLHVAGTIISNSIESKQNVKNITEIPDAVLDAWQEINFHQFQKNDENLSSEWNVGLLAQEINDAFNHKGLNPRGYGLIQFYEQEEKTITLKGKQGKGMVDINPSDPVYIINHDKCQYLELAVQRRNTTRLQAQIEELQALIAQLKHK